MIIQDLFSTESWVFRGSQPLKPAGTLRSDIVIDSRTLQVGDWFAALSGTQADGHAFVDSALLKGAAVILCTKSWFEKVQASGDRPGNQSWTRVTNTETQTGFPVLAAVNDVLLELNRLAGLRRGRYPGTVAGITGSFGKTTTKEILQEMLPDADATRGNLNNELGVPLTLLNMREDAKFWLVEMGMNHPGELTRLGELVRPDWLVYTPLGTAHAGQGSGDWLAEAKTELLRTRYPPGLVCLPAESQGYVPWLRNYSGEIIWYGNNDMSTGLHVTSSSPKEDFPNSCTTTARFEIGQQTGEKTLCWDLPSQDYAGQVALSWYLRRRSGAKDYSGTVQIRDKMKGRMQILKVENRWLVNDAYNASPETMIAGADWCERRRQEALKPDVLLGDMLELGKHSVDLHCKVLQKWLDLGVTPALFGASPEFKAASNHLGVPLDSYASVENWLAKTNAKLLYMKGSNGSGLYSSLQTYLIGQGVK